MKMNEKGWKRVAIGLIVAFAVMLSVSVVRLIIASPAVPNPGHSYRDIEIPNGVWTGLDADKVDGYHSADLLAQSGGTSSLYKACYVKDFHWESIPLCENGWEKVAGSGTNLNHIAINGLGVFRAVPSGTGYLNLMLNDITIKSTYGNYQWVVCCK